MRSAFWLMAPVVAICSFALSAADPIYLGMSAPFSGPAAELGIEYRRGAAVVFNQINQRGGIAGRQISLLSLDDGYEPIRTIENTKQFLANPALFALFGYVGTPTSNAVLPLLRQYRIPYLAPLTGAELLHQPQDDFIYNFRASYVDEVKAQIDYFVGKRGITRIALMIQADEFGASLEDAISTALAPYHIRPVNISRFRRNSSDIESAMTQIQQSAPQLVMLIGTYTPVAEAINLAASREFMPLFSTISFAGVSALQKRLKQFINVYASMVMPDPLLDSAITNSYRQNMQLSGNNVLSDISLEGYLAAVTVVNALQECRLNIDTDCLMRQLQQYSVWNADDFAAHTITYPPVFLMRITDEQLLPVDTETHRTTRQD